MNSNLHLLKVVGECFNFIVVCEALNHGSYQVIVYA